MIPHQSDRAFGLTFSVIFSVISAIGWWAYEIPLYWAMVVAALFLIAALLAPWILMPFNRIWFVFSQQLGIVVNYLISVTFFFALLLPYNYLFRLIGRDPMKRSYDLKAKSYFTKVDRKVNAETFRDMF